MTNFKLTDTQLMLLSRASQREDLLVTIPETLKGGAVKAVVSKLLTHSLVEEILVGRGDPSWRKDEHEQAIGLKLTRAGLEAIGIEPDEAAVGDERASPELASDGPQHAPITRPARGGSKRALMVAMLAREEGATLDDLVDATGWLPQTTRAALTGLRQRGYALTKHKGEAGRSVYRITGAPTPAVTNESSGVEA